MYTLVITVHSNDGVEKIWNNKYISWGGGSDLDVDRKEMWPSSKRQLARFTVTIDWYMDIYNIINICILFSKFLLYNKVLTRTVSGKSPEYPETHMQYSRREPLSFVTPKYSRQNKIKPCFVCSFQFRNFSLYHFLLRFQPGSIVDFESPLGAQRTWIEDWRPSRH